MLGKLDGSHYNGLRCRHVVHYKINLRLNFHNRITVNEEIRTSPCCMITAPAAKAIGVSSIIGEQN
jgi:hypothetical protein